MVCRFAEIEVFFTRTHPYNIVLLCGVAQIAFFSYSAARNVLLHAGIPEAIPQHGCFGRLVLDSFSDKQVESMFF